MVLDDIPPPGNRLFKNHILAKKDDFTRLENMKGTKREARKNVLFTFAFQVENVHNNYLICQKEQKVVLF